MIKPSYLQGDPRIVITSDGSHLQFTGGQPLMDHGLENMALIALFTRKGWCGNAYLKTPIGSDFEVACNQPITKNNLINVQNMAKLALNNSAFGSVSVAVTNPSGSQLRVAITIKPPDAAVQEIILQKISSVWYAQFNSPCYPNVKN